MTGEAGKGHKANRLSPEQTQTFTREIPENNLDDIYDSGHVVR